jgi:hypothetical protein
MGRFVVDGGVHMDIRVLDCAFGAWIRVLGLLLGSPARCLQAHSVLLPHAPSTLRLANFV